MAIKINGATVISDAQAFTTTSTVSATGNITGGNIDTGGQISATGNITGGNIIGNVISTGPISTTGNITGGNLIVSGNLIDTGNLSITTGSTGNTWTFDTAGNLVFPGGGLIRSTLNSGNTGVALFTSNANGEVSMNWANNNFVYVDNTGTFLQGTGGNVVQLTNDGRFLVGVTSSVSLSANGNVTGANILTAGRVSATGNITGGNLLINGSAVITGNLNVQGTETIFNVANLTVNDKDIIVANNVTGGANVDGSGIQAGNPATATWFFNNATTSWQSNIGITPTANGTLSLGGASNYWGNAFLTTATVTGNVQGGNIRTAGLISATGAITGAAISGSSLSASGNVTGANLLTGGLISATGAITGAALTGTSLTVSTGNITGGNLLLSGAIEDSAQLDLRTTASNANIVLTPNGTGNVNISSNVMPTANATANIGSAALSFNTIFARATSAQYADLAEKYTADAEYAPGTVVVFGGSAEVTVDATDGDRRVAGVVSTNPSYIMNAGCAGTNVATVALTGRVPCLVIGPVSKGDLMVAAGLGRARAEADPKVGTVIGKALEDFNGAEGTIEVVVGRF
jgi:hypothetical protein